MAWIHPESFLPFGPEIFFQDLADVGLGQLSSEFYLGGPFVFGQFVLAIVDHLFLRGCLSLFEHHIDFDVLAAFCKFFSKFIKSFFFKTCDKFSQGDQAKRPSPLVRTSKLGT